MSQYWFCKTDEQINNFANFARARIATGYPVRIEIVADPKTTSQNAMQWALYRDISAQRPDMSVNDVQKYCKLRFGVGILKSVDPDFAAYYDAHFKGMTYEQKLELMSLIDITSQERFKAPQMSQYLDEIIAHWTAQGVALAVDP